MTKLWAFDFDSTVVSIESLDFLLGQSLATDPDAQTKSARLQAITQSGMQGKCSLRESIEQRLALAQPKLTHLSRKNRKMGYFRHFLKILFFYINELKIQTRLQCHKMPSGHWF